MAFNEITHVGAEDLAASPLSETRGESSTMIEESRSSGLEELAPESSVPDNLQPALELPSLPEIDILPEIESPTSLSDSSSASEDPTEELSHIGAESQDVSDEVAANNVEEEEEALVAVEEEAPSPSLQGNISMQSSSSQSNNSSGTGVVVGLLGALAGVIFAPILLPAAVGVLGFGSGGVVAGSIAASAQAALGPVAAGSAFAVAQGIGAGAAVPSSWAAATGALAGASGVLAASGSKEKNEKEEKKGTKGGKGKKGKKGLKKRKMNDTCGDLEASVNEGQSPL